MHKQPELILYHCDTSYASQKVRLYLAEKGIKYHSHHIDLRKQEQITSNYRNINPRGTVPALKDQDEIICGSTEIMLYLEKKHPIPLLLSDNKKVADKEVGFAYSHERLHDPYLRLLSYVYIFMDKDKRKKMDVNKVAELSKQHPWPERGEFLRKVLSNQVGSSEIDDAKKQIISSLDKMQLLLNQSEGEYLFGCAYSIADAVATATLFRTDKIGFNETILNKENLSNYYDRMKRRASFQAANIV